MNKILIVEDHQMMRIALTYAFKDQEDFQIVGEAVSVAEGKRMLLELDPDILLLDLYLPDGNGLELVKFRNTRKLKTRILVVSSTTKDDEILAVLKNGAEGVLGKNISPIEVLYAIKNILNGKKHLSEQASMALLKAYQHEDIGEKYLELKFSDREQHILRLLADGYLNKEISVKIGISESTVRTHMQRISQKLGIKNKRELLLYATDHYERDKP